MPKVLISDKMNPKAAQILRERGVEVDEITGKTRASAFWVRGDSLMKKRDYDNAIATA